MKSFKYKISPTAETIIGAEEISEDTIELSLAAVASLCSYMGKSFRKTRLEALSQTAPGVQSPPRASSPVLQRRQEQTRPSLGIQPEYVRAHGRARRRPPTKRDRRPWHHMYSARMAEQAHQYAELAASDDEEQLFCYS
jgi:hypothetical protein